MCLRISIWLLVPGSAEARKHYQGASMCLVVGDTVGKTWSGLSYHAACGLTWKRSRIKNEMSVWGVVRSMRHEFKQKHRCGWCLGRRMVKGCSGRWGRRDGAGPDAEGTSVPCGEVYSAGRRDIRGIWWTKSYALTFVSEGITWPTSKGQAWGKLAAR